MGEKFWIQDFETGLDRLRIHFITERGSVISVIVIQYEAYIDAKWRAIVRFDEEHGFFHRDVMSPTGEQEETIQPASDKKLALNEAIPHSGPAFRGFGIFCARFGVCPNAPCFTQGDRYSLPNLARNTA